MTKLINQENITALSEQLEAIQENSAILGRNEFMIDDKIDGYIYYEGGETKTDYMAIQYFDSGISEVIEIDSQGHISLDNNTNEYSPMYAEDLEDMAKVANVLNAWWKNLPEE